MANATEGKTETSTAQGRFVVSLPKEVGEQIDKIGAELTKKLQEETGVAFELTRAQIVQSLVRGALDARETKGSETSAAA